MQHSAAAKLVVMRRLVRPTVLHGVLCVVLAMSLAPIAAHSLDHGANSTQVPEKQITDSFLKEPATETSNSGHILFKAARRKHSKKQSKSQENAVNAVNAMEAAEVAGQAAKVAHRVADHAETIEAHAADALAYAKDALHGAAVHAGGMSNGEKEALENAGKEVDKVSDDAATATRYERSSSSTSSGATKTGDVDKMNRRLKRLQDELDQGKGGAGASDDAQMQAELRKLQQKLDAMKKAKQGQPGGVDAATEALQQKLRDLERQMKASEVARAAGLPPPPGTDSEDEIKVKLEETREQLGKLSGSQPSGDNQQRLRELQEKLDKLRQLRAKEAQLKQTPDDAALKAEIEQLRKELNAGTTPGEAERQLAGEIAKLEQEMDASPGSGIDIDASLPYGDAEPFGRENTAHDLTASSKHESDAMVDQIERAQSMEEKRAVFRALTRLRGATIAAYDGIAKSHLNNVIQYNKEHKWRDAHPMKHLASEEDDVSKWAFPHNSEEVPPAAAGSAGPAAAPAPAAPAPGL